MSSGTHYDEREIVVRVSKRIDEADGVVSIEFTPVDDEFPAWEPGSHIDVLMEDGLERQYSLCGDPADSQVWKIAVLREPESRGGSQWVHENLQEGDTLTLRGPKNNFFLVDAPTYLFIAGGIGITPLIPMMAQVEAAGADWRLVYGGRTQASMAFVEQLQGKYGDKITLWPQDVHGHIDLPNLLAEPRENFKVYSCGPEPLLAAVESHCEAWPEETLHIERFRTNVELVRDTDTAFDVILDESDLTLHIPADKSIVDVLLENGIHIPTSCREGTCGTCETVVFEGIPDHRDSYLTDSEKSSNEVMTPCCSRSHTPELVLDL